MQFPLTSTPQQFREAIPQTPELNKGLLSMTPRLETTRLVRFPAGCCTPFKGLAGLTFRTLPLTLPRNSFISRCRLHLVHHPLMNM